MNIPSLPLLLPLLLLTLLQANAFTLPNASTTINSRHLKITTPTVLQLTPRQIQFWSDVQKGLLPIESYYRTNKNQDINRIWEFVSRAKSGVSAEPLMEGHEPSEEHVDGLTAKVCVKMCLCEYISV
jgi:hypothetical protein